MITVSRSQQAVTIARNELRLLRRDSMSIALVFFIPLPFLLLMNPLYRARLRIDGVAGASGAEFAVPGLLCVFTLYVVGVVGLAFFRDHAWNTWSRIRGATSSKAAIVGGKVASLWALAAAQILFLVLVGVGLLGLRVRGGVPLLVMLVLVHASLIVSYGCALVAWCRSLPQLHALSTVVGLVVAGLGGAIAPVADFPTWIQPLSRLSPVYWLLRGYHEAFLGDLIDVSRRDVVLSIVAPLALTAVFFVAAVLRLDVEERKQAWS